MVSRNVWALEGEGLDIRVLAPTEALLGRVPGETEGLRRVLGAELLPAPGRVGSSQLAPARGPISYLRVQPHHPTVCWAACTPPLTTHVCYFVFATLGDCHVCLGFPPYKLVSSQCHRCPGLTWGWCRSFLDALRRSACLPCWSPLATTWTSQPTVLTL